MTLASWLERGRAVGRSEPIAVALLLAANLVPLAGILFLGWDVATILIIYWLENGVVGLLNVPKILLAAGPREARPRGTAPSDQAASGEPSSARVGLAAFFLVHYGLFWVVHGVFVMVLTTGLVRGALDPLGAVLSDPVVLVGTAALLISHAASLVVNFVGRREYLAVSPQSQMLQPYPRMVVLHLTILLGGFLVVQLGQPVVLVALLVVFKTAIDLLLHLREHGRRLQAADRQAQNDRREEARESLDVE